jgi:hypothetical protein
MGGDDLIAIDPEDRPKLRARQVPLLSRRAGAAAASG